MDDWMDALGHPFLLKLAFISWMTGWIYTKSSICLFFILLWVIFNGFHLILLSENGVCVDDWTYQVIQLVVHPFCSVLSSLLDDFYLLLLCLVGYLFFPPLPPFHLHLFVLVWKEGKIRFNIFFSPFLSLPFFPVCLFLSFSLTFSHS